jgi:hypothetical protein
MLLGGAARLLPVVGRLQCVGFDGVRDVVRDRHCCAQQEEIALLLRNSDVHGVASFE